MKERFLALLVDLPCEVGARLEDVGEECIPYDGSAAAHKIPHITLVPPRTLRIEEWEEKVEELSVLPSYFEVESFEPLWNTGKLGFMGSLSVGIGLDAPHVTLLDLESSGEREAEDIVDECEDTFSEFEGVRIETTSVAVIERGEGPIYTQEVGGISAFRGHWVCIHRSCPQRREESCTVDGSRCSPDSCPSIERGVLGGSKRG